MNISSKLTHLIVLVVDDEPDSIDVASEVLAFYGAEVHNATDGVEAMDLLKHIMPDLILSDLSMPNMDGWALLANVRRDPRLQHIPVIALTAHAMTGDKDRGIAAGFTSYLTKPISALTLVNDILERVPTLVA